MEFLNFNTGLTEDQKKILGEKNLSYSSLKAFKKSPRHYVQYQLRKKAPTAAMEMGSAFDILSLSPGLFDKKYAVAPDYDARTKAGKETRDAFLLKTGNRKVITSGDMHIIQRMRHEIFTNDETKLYMENLGVVQKKIFWKDKDTGLKFRGFLDDYSPDYNMDLKKCADASPEKFMRDAINFDYPLQAAMYQLGTKRLFGDKPFMYVCAESSEPFNVSVFKASNDYISYGYREYKRLIKSFVHCRDNDLWLQGYEFYAPFGHHNLELPSWVK